jgi:hypothetical protein
MSYLDQPLLPSRKQIQIIIQKTDPNHHQELMFQPDPKQRVSQRVTTLNNYQPYPNQRVTAHLLSFNQLQSSSASSALWFWMIEAD